MSRELRGRERKMDHGVEGEREKEQKNNIGRIKTKKQEEKKPTKPPQPAGFRGKEVHTGEIIPWKVHVGQSQESCFL